MTIAVIYSLEVIDVHHNYAEWLVNGRGTAKCIQVKIEFSRTRNIQSGVELNLPLRVRLLEGFPPRWGDSQHRGVLHLVDSRAKKPAREFAVSVESVDHAKPFLGSNYRKS